MSKKYWVSMPITGHVAFEVEADSRDGAIDAFWEKLENIKDVTNDSDVDFVFEYREYVTKGNVCYAEQNEVEVDVVK